MSAVATKPPATKSVTDDDRQVIPYEIDQLDLQNNQVVVVFDKTVISIISGALHRARLSDGRPHKATRSLAAKLAKICHIFNGNEAASSCLDIANEIYDFDGKCLKGIPPNSEKAESD